VHYLDNRVFDIIDALRNYEDLKVTCLTLSCSSGILHGLPECLSEPNMFLQDYEILVKQVCMKIINCMRIVANS
jgi:hypothetical protein